MAQATNPALEEHPYRVRFMLTHPLTGELHFFGDVISLVPALANIAEVRDRVVRVTDGTPLGNAPRSRPSVIIGTHMSEEEYEAKLILEATGRAARQHAAQAQAQASA